MRIEFATSHMRMTKERENNFVTGDNQTCDLTHEEIQGKWGRPREWKDSTLLQKGNKRKGTNYKIYNRWELEKQLQKSVIGESWICNLTYEGTKGRGIVYIIIKMEQGKGKQFCSQWELNLWPHTWGGPREGEEFTLLQKETKGKRKSCKNLQHIRIEFATSFMEPKEGKTVAKLTTGENCKKNYKNL